MRRFDVLLGLLLLTACAPLSRPPAQPVPGGVVQSLRSDVTVSLQTSQGEQGGRGYLVYQRPGRFHLAMLSPFGTPVLHLYGNGEQLLVLYPGEQLAYSGKLADLSALPALYGWRSLPWLVQSFDLNARQGGALAEVVLAGERCRVSYDASGLVSGLAANGDQLLLTDYAMVAGVPLPLTIRFASRRGEAAELRLQEPEANVTLEEQSLVPELDQIRVRPLPRGGL